MMTTSQKFDRAHDKAFAQIHHLQLSIRRAKEDIRLGMLGGLTEEQLELILISNQRELETWKYIAELIEKSNKDE
jgi:hypothetical protein